jgi:DNA-binding response OmpR family regulator
MAYHALSNQGGIMSTRVLIVERGHAQRSSYVDALQRRYEVITASSGKQAIEIASKQPPHAVILDAISMRTPGERICQQLRDHIVHTPLIHLHPGEKGTAESCADVILFQPFTSRKLANAIERLLREADAPAPNGIVTVGPFTLNSERRVLVFSGQEQALTPKLVQLVALFLQHPGETLDRKRLMEQVWNTDYMGDTRTLDVHVRWIRRAIEENPGKPLYLKTVRGIGYRLELPATVRTPKRISERSP